MKKKLLICFKKYRLHLLIWAIYILYESVVVGIVFGNFGNPITYAAHYALIILFFYTYADWSLPWALKNSRRAFFKLPFLIIFEVTAFILLSFLVDMLLARFHILTESVRLSYKYDLKTAYRGIYFMFFSTGYYYLLTYNKEKRKTDELEKQRLNHIIDKQKTQQELAKAQNAFLKAQINPHFLFNTLDFIYHNIVSSSPVAADAIITLSEMMRYAIDSDKMGDFIRLGDEIDQVENLIHLSRLKKSRELNLNLQYDEEVRDIYLIPLVLLTLVENIFKHANLDKPGHEALIHIYLKDDTFFIETDNLIKNQIKLSQNQTGLINIKRRLDFAYESHSTFNYYADESNHFKVIISIPLLKLKWPDGSSIVLINNDKVSPRDHADQNETSC